MSDRQHAAEDPGGIPGRPGLAPREASDIAARHFGADGLAHMLPSDRDANFRIDVDGRPSFVLKVMNADADPAFLACQIDALHRAAGAGLPVPRPISPDGADAPSAADVLRRIRTSDGAEHAAWMVRWMDGTPLGNVRPVDDRLGRELGRLLGRLDRSLAGIDPAAVHRELDWDVSRAPVTVSRYIDAVSGEERRSLVRFHMDRVRRVVRAGGGRRDENGGAGGVRRAVIHGDANDFNVLVGAPAADDRQITGLLDFGDMHHSLLAAEPAIAAAYLMMHAADPVAMLAAVAAGYHESHPLSAAEIDLLYPLVCARLCISVCMSARQRALEPGNDYLSVSEDGAWRLLEMLRRIHPRLAGARVRAACGLDPVPGAERVRRALRSMEAFAPVVDPDPATSPVCVLDFSVGSTEFDFDDLTIPGRARDRIFDRIRSSGTTVGIGRYGEARIAYASSRFRTAAGDMRTRHLGVDLFLPAGSTVYCPLDGVVHSTSDNRSPRDYGPCVVIEHEIGGGSGSRDDSSDGDGVTGLNGHGADGLDPVGDGADRDRGAPLRFYTLYGHLSGASLPDIQPGDRVSAGDRIGEVGHPGENGGWVEHLHFQIVTDLLGASGTFPGVSAPNEFDAWAGFSPDPNLILRIPDLEPCDPAAERAGILDRRRRALGPSLSLHYDRPLHVVRGHMQYLYDAEGRRYLDCVNNVAHVGHANPRVVDAERRQAATLNTNTRYLHRNIVDYAERLAGRLPDGLDVCFFVNSGSEANDLAVRMARTATGRRDMIVLEGAYHGNLSTLIDLSPYKFDGRGGSGRPAGTHVVPMPDVYRGAHTGADAGRRYADYVRDACATAADRGGAAAMIAESVPGCGGQIVPPPGYLAAAARHVRAAGALFIVDEVQVGMGRPGDAFWGFERQEVVPDIVVIGKPIGNGHPLGAVVTTRAVADAFDNGMEYFNTFGGNPVSCAVGLAVLDEIERSDLQARAGRIGRRLKDGLAELTSRHEIVGDVRGVGLFLGVELVRDRTTLEPATDEARYVVNRLARRGILASTDGPHANVIKIKPPLPFSTDDADRFVEELDRVLRHDYVRV